MSRSYLLSLAFIFLALYGKTQDENLEVIRSTALPWGSPVQNIFVDTDNTKWASNTQSIMKVIGARSSDPILLKPGEMGLFQFPGGNADIKWQREALTQAIGDIIDEDNYITAAFYDEVRKDIWLGTSLTGAFRLKQENGTLVFQEQLSMDNTKLRSNFVHDIAKDGPGRIWIATDDGALVGQNGKWDLIEKGLIIESIAIANGEIWLMGDGLIGKVGRKDSWELIDLPASDIEGNITDIALDGDGRLWIASRIITRFDPASGATKTFGGAEEYTSEFANYLAVDLDGAVWIGTEDKGVYVIQEGSSLVATVELVSPVTCGGNGADGALRVKVTGGTPPYNFAWSGNAEGDSPSGLTPGTYRLTITDTKENSRLADISVPDRRINMKAEAKSEVSAPGATDGRAEARVQGGMPPYKYAWDNGETTPTAVKLGEGEHSVTVTDRLGCEISAVVNVSRVLEELAVQIEQIKPIKCQGNKSAVLKVVAEGGEKPYTYKWSVADSPTPQLTGLLAGSYAVTVTDGNGATATTSFTVEEPAAFNVNASVVQPATANGSDGEAVATADGGVAPYQFVWSNGGATASAAGLSAGKYTVTVTDANGCPTTAEVVVVEDILPLALTIGQDEKIDCQGAAAAALSAAVTGGKAPFTYQWSNGKAAESIKGLPAGPYAITVTDATGAKAEANFTVEEPQALQARANQITPANTGASDGIAEVTVNGGVAPYKYVWTNGATTANIENLLAGPYTVTVTDQNNCKATAKVEVTEDIAPLEVTLELGKPVSCVDGADGEIMAVINGGKGPFAYAWSNGSTTEKQIQALAAGNYTLTVTDIAGNTANAAFTLSGPEKLKVGVEVTQEATTNESDGKAIVTATGGNGGYSYLWTSGETAAEATRLAAGMQTVTITDAKGCTSSISVEMVEDIQPLQVSIAEDQAVSCADATDGALTASIKGGKGPYTYNWSSGAKEQNATALGAASYTLTITDAQGATAEASFELSAPAALNATSKTVQPASTNNADGIISASAQGGTSPYTYSWSSGASSETVEGLAPGQYTVTVTDSKGCTATASTEVTENILPLQVSLTEVLPVNCNGGNSGAIASEVNGGKSPYTYEWSGGQDNGKAEQLTAGTYGLTVTDAVGSTATASISLQEPNALSANIMIVQPASTNAKDGKAKAIAEGGTPPYNYDWSSEIYADLADNLAPGQHTVTVTDAKGCKTEAEVSITENILPLELSLDVSAPINCNGGAGAVNAAVSGGKSPFAYAWSNGATEPQAAGLSAGTYGLTLTDAAGTTVEQEITLTQPDALTASALAVQPASTNNTDGIAKVSPNGGTAPYTYAWSTGANTEEANNLAPKTHTITVTDANGCTAAASVEITENILPLQVQFDAVQQISCNAGSDGSIQTAIAGGKPPYTIAWSDGDTDSENRNNLAPGQYEVTISDQAGNEASAAITLSAPEALVAEMGRIEPAFSDTSEDGKAEVSGKGGTPPYEYKWDNGSSGAKVENLGLGNHNVTVSDANGCTAVVDFEITERVLKELTRAVSSGQTIQMQKLQFEADSSQIQETVKPLLNEIYIFLKDNPSIVVEIGGHTNNLPPDEYCDQLSTARARAVAEYMVGKGIPSDRVFYKGYGKRKPLFSNRTEDGRRRNQRVEIKILRL